MGSVLYIGIEHDELKGVAKTLGIKWGTDLFMQLRSIIAGARNQLMENAK